MKFGMVSYKLYGVAWSFPCHYLHIYVMLAVPQYLELISLDSTMYRFGPQSGLIMFTYQEGEYPNRNFDELAIRFKTVQSNAVIMRIDSATSNDYMELELVKGNLFLVYNMGTTDHPIQDLSEKVNDGIFHNIRFSRSGPNATLRVDDHPIQTKNPEPCYNVNCLDQQVGVFDSLHKIQIGGKESKDRIGAIDRPFKGVMAGLVFNSVHIFDLANENDSRVVIIGDARQINSTDVSRKLNISPDFLDSLKQQSTTTAPDKLDLWKGKDEIILSGDGPCESDDEDDCEFDTSGSGDELISPALVPVTTGKPALTTAVSPITQHITTFVPPSTHTTSGKIWTVKPLPAATKIPRTDTSGPSTVSRDHFEGSGCDDEELCASGSGELYAESNINVIPTEKSPTMQSTKLSKASMVMTTLMASISTIKTTSLDDFFISNSSNPVPLSVTSEKPEVTTEDIFVIETITEYSNKKSTHSPAENNHGHKEASEERPGETQRNLILIVSIVGAILLAMFVLGIVLYKVCSKKNGVCKVNENKNFQFTPPLATVIMASRTNGGVNSKVGKLTKKKDLKDVKEWYV